MLRQSIRPSAGASIALRLLLLSQNALPLGAAAQQLLPGAPTDARLQGIVVCQETGQPVESATVSMVGTDIEMRTGRYGDFEFPDAQPRIAVHQSHRTGESQRHAGGRFQGRWHRLPSVAKRTRQPLGDHGATRLPQWCQLLDLGDGPRGTEQDPRFERVGNRGPAGPRRCVPLPAPRARPFSVGRLSNSQLALDAADADSAGDDRHLTGISRSRTTAGAIPAFEIRVEVVLRLRHVQAHPSAQRIAEGRPLTDEAGEPKLVGIPDLSGPEPPRLTQLRGRPASPRRSLTRAMAASPPSISAWMSQSSRPLTRGIGSVSPYLVGRNWGG